MTCSPARMAANKANASRSTGPRSDRGKDRSRENSLKHGLTATTLVTAEEAAALADQGPVALHLAGEVVLLTMRIDRAQQIEERERSHGAMRATLCWDEDRNDEVDQIARGLAKHPERVARKLRRTSHGCLWLIDRWKWLRRAANQEGGWKDAHQTLAADLQGIPLDFRFDTVPADQQAALVDRELAVLEKQHTKLIPCNDFERESARCGLSNEATPELRRVLRYEAALNRRLQWCLNHAPQAAPSVPAPAEVSALTPTATPAPTPTSAPAPASPSNLIDFDRDLNVPAGRRPLDLPPAMGSMLPLSMIPPGSRARVG